MKKWILALLFGLSLVTPLWAQDELQAPIPIDPKVTIGKLDNGLTYYIRKNGKPEKRAEIRLVVNAGSILEGEDQRGIAHFLEHMAFNGTKNFKKMELVEYLQSLGMRFGADVNAYTSFDETVYMLTVPTDDRAILEKAFLILEDWAHQIDLDPEEIENERGIVIEEWRLGQGASRRVFDKQIPVLLKGSRYANRLAIGLKDVIENAPREAFTRFYKDWYRPDMMAVVAVGDFEPGQIKALVEKHFSRIVPVEKPKPRPTYDVPGHDETLFSIVTDPELTNATVEVSYKHPNRPLTILAEFRQSLVESIKQRMLNQRLYERSREEKPPFVQGYSSLSSGFVRPLDLFTQGATIRDDAFEEGLTALLLEAKRAKQYGFTQPELDRVKKDILSSLEKAYNERDKSNSARYAGQYVTHFLEGTTIMGIEHSYLFFKKHLPGISLAEVNATLGKWITAENRVLGFSGPEKDGAFVPTREQFLEVIAKAAAMEVEPYREEVSEAPLLAKKPESVKVVEEKTLEALGVTEWKLGNGVRVLLKPTDFKNDEVVMLAFSPGGSSLTSDENYVPAMTATTIIGESGLADYSAIELEKKLAGKVVSVSPFINELAEGFNASAAPKDLETMFQLVYLFFTQPRIDRAAFVSTLTRWQSIIKNREANPQVVFGDKFTETVFRDHPRRQPFDKDTLRQMNPDKSIAFYRDRFADASDFTFILVGNLDLDGIKPMIETYLGGLPVTQRGEKWKDIGLSYAEGKAEVIVHKGLEPKGLVQLMFHGETEWSSPASLAMSSMTYALNIRLREVLREELAGVYGVNVGGNLSRYPKGRYTVSLSFGCDPGKVDDLIKAAFDEIKKIQAEGLGDSYIQKIREYRTRQYETSVKRNGYWATSLRYYLENNMDPIGILEFNQRTETITSDMIRDAANRYFNFDNFVKAVLYPRKEESE